jgi:hypothetical protein
VWTGHGASFALAAVFAAALRDRGVPARAEPFASCVPSGQELLCVVSARGQGAIEVHGAPRNGLLVTSANTAKGALLLVEPGECHAWFPLRCKRQPKSASPWRSTSICPPKHRGPETERGPRAAARRWQQLLLGWLLGLLPRA